MRLWSIHPKYLDSIGLVACWREGLLALNVLLGKTKGYKNHPQLDRFKKLENPLIGINAFLTQIFLEGKNRNYNFDSNKIEIIENFSPKINVNFGQIEYEFSWLLEKLKVRNIEKFELYKNEKIIEANLIFEIISGQVESWEKININPIGQN